MSLFLFSWERRANRAAAVAATKECAIADNRTAALLQLCTEWSAFDGRKNVENDGKSYASHQRRATFRPPRIRVYYFVILYTVIFRSQRWFCGLIAAPLLKTSFALPRRQHRYFNIIIIIILYLYIILVFFFFSIRRSGSQRVSSNINMVRTKIFIYIPRYLYNNTTRIILLLFYF